MKKLLITVIMTTFLLGAEKFQAVQPPQKMDWERASRFCFNIGGRMPTVEQIEVAYKYKALGTNVDYRNSVYWTRTDVNLEAAMSYDFSLGLAYPDHKANRYSVMCVR